jgi:hypothetical protein
MWDVALMLPLKVFGDIRSIEKSPYLSALSDARKANLTEIQARLSITHIFRCVRKSCLDAIIPGVFRVAVEVIVIDNRLY